MLITSSPDHYHRLSEFDEFTCRPPTHPIAYHAGCQSPAPSRAFHVRLIETVNKMSSRLRRTLREKAVLRELREKEDHLLLDIGISRRDLLELENRTETSGTTLQLSRIARRNNKKSIPNLSCC